MLTQTEASAVYHSMMATGFALPGKQNIDRFVEAQTSSFVIVYLVPSAFYPAQFYSTERDGGRWQVSIMGASAEQQEIVKKTNEELLKLWNSFS